MTGTSVIAIHAATLALAVPCICAHIIPFLLGDTQSCNKGAEAWCRLAQQECLVRVCRQSEPIRAAAVSQLSKFLLRGDRAILRNVAHEYSRCGARAPSQKQTALWSHISGVDDIESSVRNDQRTGDVLQAGIEPADMNVLVHRR